ncbi:6-phosphogluconolactonase, partial [bacterium]|nr:6-phosphogluconolactonase [bacterium]
MRTEIVVTDRFPETASSWLRRLLDSAIRSRGTCSVALAGGSTPRAVYERLVRGDKVQRPWICSQEIDFFFGDERCVPPDHEESNYRMATEALGSSPSWRFHRIAA